MSHLLSHAYRNTVLNGHRFVLLAGEEPPVDFEFEDSAEVERGPDGTLNGLGNARLGGEMTVMVQPGSRSVQWCIQEEVARQNSILDGGFQRTYAGSHEDTAQEISYTLEGGLIINLPPVNIPGEPYEAKWDFERIIPEVDAGKFFEAFQAPVL